MSTPDAPGRPPSGSTPSPRPTPGPEAASAPLPLRVAAAVELASLVLLLLNLATVHAPAISAALGPLHGLAYVGVIASTLALEGAPGRTRALALVPGVGGRLVLARLSGPEA